MSSPTQTVEEPSAAHDAPKARKLFLEDLGGEHRRLLIRAIERVLSTEVAEFTYAQVIDGLPTSDVAFDTRDKPYGYGQHVHPMYSAHDELCPGTIEKARQFRSGFQPEIGDGTRMGRFQHSSSTRGTKITISILEGWPTWLDTGRRRAFWAALSSSTGVIPMLN